MGYEDNTLVVGFTEEHTFHKEALSDRPNLILVQKKLSEKIGREVRIHLDLIKDDGKKEHGKAHRDTRHTAAHSPAAKKEEDVHNHPHVQEVLDIFEGKVVRVKK